MLLITDNIYAVYYFMYYILYSFKRNFGKRFAVFYISSQSHGKELFNSGCTILPSSYSIFLRIILVNK